MFSFKKPEVEKLKVETLKAEKFRASSILLMSAVFFGLCVSSVVAEAAQGTQGTQGSRAWSGLGRTATPAEIKAWDIDVRPDFKGLPVGAGSAKQGMEIWEDKCASCHGVFGESNEVFTPIVGGTNAEDIKAGRVRSLKRTDYPQRTTLMKLSQLSTLWDYINRAMPWNLPKSLSVTEVYAVTAYILHLGDIVPADYVLSDKNMMATQALLPNRHGKLAFAAGMWSLSGPQKGRPDVQGDACIRNCTVSGELKSRLPEHARDAHGNLADQQRGVGPMRGQVTRAESMRAAAPAPAISAMTVASSSSVGASAAIAVAAPTLSAIELAKQANCMACHGVANRLVGPSFKEVEARYKGDAAAPEALAGKIKNGGQGQWGQMPMPASAQLKDQEVRSLVQWILDGAK